MAEWIIEPFGKHHERAAFCCGRPQLDDFIRSRVSQYEKRRLGKTFVAVPSGKPLVTGYYTLAAGSVMFDHIPVKAVRKLPKHPVPVVLLARFAVDVAAQGKRLGEGLLLDALQRSAELSAGLGIHAVEVHAIDDAAVAFYRKYGFTPLLDSPRHLRAAVGDLRTQAAAVALGRTSRSRLHTHEDLHEPQPMPASSSDGSKTHSPRPNAFGTCVIARPCKQANSPRYTHAGKRDVRVAPYEFSPRILSRRVPSFTVAPGTLQCRHGRPGGGPVH